MSEKTIDNLTESEIKATWQGIERSHDLAIAFAKLGQWPDVWESLQAISMGYRLLEMDAKLTQIMGAEKKA